MNKPLVDSYGRLHTNLRISITDRCNIRCFYCMPDENIRFKPRHEILTFEEIQRIVRIVASRGVNKLRITGGEPLLRADLPELIAQLVATSGITDVALTTNGVLLAEQATALREAGLHRLNISLDTLKEETFQQISRRTGLQRVLDGIQAAQNAGFDKIRLNAIAIAGLTEAEIVPLGHFAREHKMELRFIEFMPLDADNAWKTELVLPGSEIRRRLEEEFGALVASDRPDPSQPAMDYEFADGGGRIGLINPVSEPFCQDCNRLRITAEGQLRNCLFSTVEWDARELLRGTGSDEEISDLLDACLADKKASHGIDEEGFQRPDRAMYQIGG
jgi:cyclic pyranopterin phosphate synthase